jgi:hypothetical protein
MLVGGWVRPIKTNTREIYTSKLLLTFITNVLST